MAQASSFTSVYERICSEQMIEKAKSWETRMSQHSPSKHYLKKGRLYSTAEFKFHKKYGCEAYDFLLALDITTRCVEAYSVVCLEKITSELSELDDEGAATTRSVCSLVLYISQLCKAAQREVLYFNDISARILARSISEASDYILAMLNDSKLAGSYVETTDPNSFWYQNLRSKDVNKLRDNALRNIIGMDSAALLEFEDYRKRENSSFSEAVHPSYGAGIMHLFNYGRIENLDPGWDFLRNWPLARVTGNVIYSIGVSISVAIISSIPKDGCSKPNFAMLEKSAYGNTREYVEAILHGIMLSSSFAIHSHVLHPPSQLSLETPS